MESGRGLAREKLQEIRIGGQGGGGCFSPGCRRGAAHFTFLFSNPEPVVKNRSCESPHGPEKGFSAASRFRPEYAEGESLYSGNRRTTWFPSFMSPSRSYRSRSSVWSRPWWRPDGRFSK